MKGYLEQEGIPTPDNPIEIKTQIIGKNLFEIKEKDKEIERLNNIIDELENWCLSWKENDKYCYLSSNDKDKCRYDIWKEVLDKLKELKEGK